MDLNQLAVFVRVVDCGSFTKAGRLLKQPKSRVSRRIAALESELGVSLLYRTTRQFSLTEAGRALYEESREHVYLLDRAAESLFKTSKDVRGTLKITAAEDVGNILLAPLIIEMSKLYPNLNIDLHLSNEVMDLVREGIDVAVRIGPLKDGSNKQKALGQIALILVASPHYLKSAKKISKIKELSEHRCLAFLPNRTENRWLLRELNGNREEIQLRAFHGANSPKVLLEMALAGQGVALLPRFLCLAALKEGRLKQLFPMYSTDPIPTHLVWPAHRESNPAVRAFIDIAVKNLKKYFVGASPTN